MKTLHTYRFIIVALILLSGIGVAAAQVVDPFSQLLRKYNRLPPMQNPIWVTAKDVRDYRVLSNKNRVVAFVQDLALSPNGRVSFIKVEMERASLRQHVYFSTDLLSGRAARNSYILEYDSDEFEDLYPEFRKNRDRADARNSSLYSVEYMPGAEVKARDGRIIGELVEVMLNEPATVAEALLFRINFSTIRDKMVAVPFDSVRIMKEGLEYRIQVDNNKADQILALAKAED